MVSESDLQQMLDGLGDNHAEVAESLRAAGVKGIRHDAYHCPVANYVKMMCGEDMVLTAYLATHVLEPSYGLSTRARATNSIAIRYFIELFDRGLEYEDLQS